MPEGFGYGGDEVEATTRNKTVKKTESQLESEGKLIGRGIGTETPQQKQFRKQVESSVSDPTTRKDVLKAAGIKSLPGTGISSTPPPKKKPVSRAAQQRKHPGVQRMVDAMRAAGLSEQRINQYLSVQFSAGPGTERRAERREKFLRRQAAEKYGTPP